VYASPLKARKAFRERYATTHELTEEIDERIEEVFAKLHGLKDFTFTVVELQPTVDREKVAEIFVRINSEASTSPKRTSFSLGLVSSGRRTR